MTNKHLIQQLSSVLYSVETNDNLQAKLQLESIVKRLAKERQPELENLKRGFAGK